MRNILSKLYGAYIQRRNRKFDAGTGIEKVDIPVLSVGNLTMGGTGKTPFVQFLVRGLLQRGRKVAIVSRGYGRRSKGVVEVSDGEHVLVNVEQSGDELQLLAQSLRSAVVIAAEVRYHGAMRAIRKYGVDCIVIDDGFQHRQFRRDCDIVLVDRNTLDYPHIMPMGRLREPMESLRRADVICCVGGVQKSEVPLQTDAIIIEAETVANGYTSVDSIHAAPKPKRAVVLAAIANPERFVQSLQKDGVDCASTIFLRDHQRYEQPHIDSVIAECTKHGVLNVLTTQKDAVKLVRFASAFEQAGIQLAALEIKTRLNSGAEDFWQHIEQTILTTTDT